MGVNMATSPALVKDSIYRNLQKFPCGPHNHQPRSIGFTPLTWTVTSSTPRLGDLDFPVAAQCTECGKDCGPHACSICDEESHHDAVPVSHANLSIPLSARLCEMCYWELREPLLFDTSGWALA